MNKHKKILVIGGSGSGKSTLAKKIAENTGYPLVHLDEIFLNDNWERADKEKLQELSKEFLSKDSGVIDGNYSNVLPARLEWADLVIFIDVSAARQLYRILGRYLKHKTGIEKRIAYPKGSKNKLSLKFLAWTYNWNRTHRKKTMDLLKNAHGKKIVFVKHPKKLKLEKVLTK